MTSVPNLNLPSSQAPGLSALYVDGVRLDDLVTLYDLNTQLLGGQKWDSPNQFWATPARYGTAPNRDVLEVSLNAPKWTNHFSFDISRFPCRIWLLWWDSASNKWAPVRDRMTKRPVKITINESVPSRISPHVVGSEHRHPHHRDPNHWQHIEVSAEAVVANKFRLVLAHLPSKNVPTAVGTRKAIKYSLAVKEFQPGFDARDRNDVPQSQIRTQNVAESNTFASSVDLLGSPVEFSMVEYRAQDLLWPSLQKIEKLAPDLRSGDGEVWKCEPQPVPYAVVNLYVDARDGQGDGQIIDRFEVNPTTTGVSCNLYYSNDSFDVSQGFEASDEPLRFPAIQPHGIVSVSPEGTLFPSDPPVPGDPSIPPAYLDINSTFVQWDDSQDWWFGLRFQPQFDSTSTSNWVLLDTPRAKIVWDGTLLAWVFTVDDSVVVRDNFTFERNERLALTVRWSSGHVRVNMIGDWSADAPTTSDSAGHLDPSIPADSALRHTLRFGGLLVPEGNDPGLGGYRLNYFVLKQETFNADLRQDFFEVDPDLYLRKPDVNEDPRDYTRNALLRILPFYQTRGMESRNPFGVVGGPGTAYESLVWTPINRDFKLHRGFLTFDPVKAKFFKFEFTNLSPQPYDAPEPVLRKVRLFTDDIISSSIGLRTTSGQADRGSGTDVSLVALRRPLYSDQNRLVTQIDPFRSYDGYTPTEAYYSSDPQAQDRLSALNPAFRLQPWHRPAGAPRFVNTQRHYYETVTIRHSSKVAYFVGLSGLRMFRVNYTSSDDTDAYLIPFLDRAGLDDQHDGLPWSSIPEGGLLSPGLIPSSGAVTTSLPLLSRRNVRGVQFATMQTPPHQTLSDPDFNDTTLQYWEEYGDATIEASAEFNSNIGSTVKVTRHASSDAGQAIEAADWTDIEALGTWDAIEAINPHPAYPTWDEITEITVSSVLSFGGIQGSLLRSALVQPAAKGRMYAASRVYCPEGVKAPLRVQIITATGSVLADAQVQPKAGQITEWFCSYQIGSAGYSNSTDPTGGQPVAILNPHSIPNKVASQDISPTNVRDQVTHDANNIALTGSAATMWGDADDATYAYRLTSEKATAVMLADVAARSFTGSVTSVTASLRVLLDSGNADTHVDFWIAPLGTENPAADTSALAAYSAMDTSGTEPTATPGTITTLNNLVLMSKATGVPMTAAQLNSLFTSGFTVGVARNDPAAAAAALTVYELTFHVTTTQTFDVAYLGDSNSGTYYDGEYSTPSAVSDPLIANYDSPTPLASITSPVITLSTFNSGAGTSGAERVSLVLQDIATNGAQFKAQWYVTLWGTDQIVTLTDWPLQASVTYPVTEHVSRWEFENQSSGAGPLDSPWAEARTRLAAGDLQLVVTRGTDPSDADPLDRFVRVYETGFTYPFSGETWDQVSLNDTRTWDAMEALGSWDDIAGLGYWNPGGGGPGFTPYTGPVTARVFQDGPTNDVFYVDNLSLFEDPIVWEFSNNGGIDWYPALDIRNDPHGVLLFPTTPNDTLTPSESTSLRWRVSAYQPNQRIKALFIRPWYSTLPLGVPSRETIQHGGPNISQYDQYPDIEDSPPFKVWHKPIPEDWWFLHRQWILRPGIITTPQVTDFYLPETIVYSP